MKPARRTQKFRYVLFNFLNKKYVLLNIDNLMVSTFMCGGKSETSTQACSEIGIFKPMRLDIQSKIQTVYSIT